MERERGKAHIVNIADLRDDPDLLATIQQAVDDANLAVSAGEAIKSFRIIANPFVVGDELTPTQKVRRHTYWPNSPTKWKRCTHHPSRPGSWCASRAGGFAMSEKARDAGEKAAVEGAHVDQLSLAVMSRSNKEDERRLSIYPRHMERIDADLRRSIFLECGYGERFGVPDERLAPLVAGLLPRSRLIAECDGILLPKPLPQDLAELRHGQILWGWPHCVQSDEITQLAIDRRLTLIAFEAMNHWSHDGEFSLHVFHKNNELAGYCSVLHALALIGTTGDYGRRLRAAVIGFGATGRGAVTALNAHGIHDVDVLTHGGAMAVGSPIHSTRIMHFAPDPDDPNRSNVQLDGGPVPMAAFLAEHDIVVNCVLQRTDASSHPAHGSMEAWGRWSLPAGTTGTEERGRQ